MESPSDKMILLTDRVDEVWDGSGKAVILLSTNVGFRPNNKERGKKEGELPGQQN
jgi:hypothetical protein